MQEGEEDVEQHLCVGLPADSAAQELWNAGHQPLPDALELGHRAGLREEPLPVAERVGVLGPQRTHRRVAHVADEHIGTHVGREATYLELPALVDRAPPHEDLAALVEAEAPAERRPAGARTQRVPLGREDA